MKECEKCLRIYKDDVAFCPYCGEEMKNLFFPKDATEELQRIWERAVNGDIEAQKSLGHRYEFGYACKFGTVRDQKGAERWYKRAAMQGDREAQEALERLLSQRKACSRCGKLEYPDMMAGDVCLDCFLLPVRTAPLCPHCGKPHTAEGKFCVYCGQPLQAGGSRTSSPQPAQRLCPTCGAKLLPGRAFCTNCGTKLA